MNDYFMSGFMINIFLSTSLIYIYKTKFLIMCVCIYVTIAQHMLPRYLLVQYLKLPGVSSWCNG